MLGLASGALVNAIGFRAVIGIMLLLLGIVGSDHELAVAVQRQGLQDEVEAVALVMRKGDANIQPIVFLLRPLGVARGGRLRRRNISVSNPMCCGRAPPVDLMPG